jgi:crotonobetainyl-CoA:carnitine CoA-transferase CaiB-like acyl-CoA transferase
MNRPLASLKVLDFSTLLPGPFATMVLADLGAEVVRVEAPDRLDWVRLLPPFDGDVSAWHALLNRNKRSLAIDLKQPGADAVIHRLVQRFDIVVEQFRPGVMDRLGIGYAALSAANPRLIYCAITGYGQTGPYRDRAGHDINYLALAGVLSHSGRQASGPAGLGVQIADVGGGSFGAITGILAAVIQRQLTGLGQLVDISMADMALAWNSLAASEWLVGGDLRDYESGPLDGGSPYDCYRTQDGRYLSVGSLEPKFWQAFCEAIGRPELASASIVTKSQAEAKSQVAEAIAQKTLAEWQAVFEPLDACVEPVLTVAEALEHPQVAARGMVVEVPKLNGAAQRQVASPFRLSGSEAQYRTIGAPAGHDTDTVLIENDFSAEEIASLRKRLIVR